MIDRYLNEEDRIAKIIVDISSGHNIYVSALIEAFRYLGIWIKLYSWNGVIPSLEIAFSDPIIQGISRFRINTEELKIQAFFSSLVGYEDLNNNALVLKIYLEVNRRHKKRQLQSFLECFVVIFSTIKNSTPIAIYTFGYHELDDIKKAFNDFICFIECKLTKAYNSSPNLNKLAFIKVILTFAFYMGLHKILQSKNVHWNEEIEINKLKDDFWAIYKTFNLNLNDTILGNEIDKIQKALKEGKDTE